MPTVTSNQTAALLLFLAYALVDQWAFRCQRVGRGILLLAKDSAAAHPGLFSAIMPTSFVNAMWLKRVLLLACAYFGWKSWGWWALLPLLLYAFVFGVFVDSFSPWPSYAKLLGLFKARIRSGRAGLEALALGPAIAHIEQQLAAGVQFEKATTAAWVERAAEAGRRSAAINAGIK